MRVADVLRLDAFSKPAAGVSLFSISGKHLQTRCRAPGLLSSPVTLFCLPLEVYVKLFHDPRWRFFRKHERDLPTTAASTKGPRANHPFLDTDSLPAQRETRLERKPAAEKNATETERFPRAHKALFLAAL